MTNEEIDVLTAEKVMGWTREEDKPWSPWRYKKNGRWHDTGWPDGGYCGTPECERSEPFSPTDDPLADYLVLKRVRETWKFSDRCKFVGAITLVINSRCGEKPADGWRFMFYQPGDYARAALLTLDDVKIEDVLGPLSEGSE